MLVKVLVFLFMIAVMGINSACSHNPKLPKRSECIVKIDLDWPEGIAAKEREQVISAIAYSILFSEARGGPSVKSHMAVPRDNRGVVFLQFKRDCKNKIANAKRQMEYVKQVVPKTPVYKVSGDVILPGLDTIDSSGPDWRD